MALLADCDQTRSYVCHSQRPFHFQFEFQVFKFVFNFTRVTNGLATCPLHKLLTDSLAE